MNSRKKTYVLAGLILLLLILPHSRNLFIVQLAAAVNHDYGQLGNHCVIKPAGPRAADDVGHALVLGYRKCRDASSIDPFFRTIARFPNEPALCANLLKYAVVFRVLTDKAWATEIENVIKAGQRLEPDNGYFNYYEAVLRFHQKRDAEGLAAVHRAAEKKRFNTHQTEETLALMRYSQERWPFPLGWVNPLCRVFNSVSIPYPQLAYFRKAAVTVQSYEQQDMKEGRMHSGTQKMADLVEIGGLIRDEGETYNSTFVGIAIQKVAVNGIYLNQTIEGGVPLAEAFPTLQPIVSKELGEAEWHALSKNLARSDDFRLRDKSFMKHFSSPGHIAQMLGSVIWFSYAGSLLFMALPFGLIWLAAYAILRKRGRHQLTDLGPSRLSTGLLAVAPISIGLLVFAGLAIAMVFSPQHHAYRYSSVIPVLCLAIMIVVGIASARTRIRPEVPRLDTFLARLSTGSAYAAKAFLVLYVAAMIINIPATAWANRQWDNQALHQAEIIWHYPPAK